MKGRPWIKIAAVLLVFLLLGWPVWSVTSGSMVQPAVATPATEMSKEPVQITLTFSEPPGSFALSYLGKTVCAGQGPGREFTGTFAAAIPPEGVELLLKVEWAAGAPKAAVRVEAGRKDDPMVNQTFWSKGPLVETVLLSGQPKP